ncbi:hypothetical protein, partial [Acidithiobacillus ferrooxidans]
FVPLHHQVIRLTWPWGISHQQQDIARLVHAQAGSHLHSAAITGLLNFFINGMPNIRWQFSMLPYLGVL